MSNKDEIDFVSAQVRAAESEVEAARARAEAARMQVESTKTRSDVYTEQLEAAKSQVAAAQSQAKAASAQKDAATVQAEAAIAQVEATREQNESIKSQLVVVRTQTETMEEQGEAIKSQVSLMRTQTETLQDQLVVVRKQARSTTWLAVLATLASLSLTALAGLAVYGFLTGSSSPMVADGSGVTTPEESAAEGAEGETGNSSDTAGDESVDVSAQLAPLQAEQERANKSLDALSTRLGLLASRLVDDDGGSTTKRIKVLSPPIESPDLSWGTSALKQWISEGEPTPQGSRNVYVVKGTVKRPVRPGQRVTIDVHEGRWWPGGSPIDVPTNGSWSGSIVLDPSAPPERLRVTLWDGYQAASREYSFSASGETAQEVSDTPEESPSASSPPNNTDAPAEPAPASDEAASPEAAQQ